MDQIGAVETTKGGKEDGITRRISSGTLLLFIFVVPWENVVVFPVVGTLARLLGIALLCFYLLSVAVSGRLRTPAPFHVLAVAFALWGLTTVAWSVDYAASILFSVTLVQLVALTYLIHDLVDDGLAHARVRMAAVLGGFVTSTLLIFNGLTGNTSEFDNRATIANSNENDIGIVLAMLMPIAWDFAARQENSMRTRCISGLYLPVAFLGIVFTASRTSLLVVLAFVAVLLFNLGRSGKAQRIFSALIVVGAGAVATMSAPESSFERFGTIQQSVRRGDFGSRQYFWAKAWELITDSATRTVTGFGVGTFNAIVGDSAHQTFLALTVEVGIVGLLLFGSLLFVVVRHVRTLERSKRQMWTSVMLMWLIGVQTLSWQFFTFTWLVMALIIADKDWPRASRSTLASTEEIIDLRTPAAMR